jgi:hypothetical protein
VVAVLGLLLAAASCRPELVVRFATTVYHDGGVGREVELALSAVGDGEGPADEPPQEGLAEIGADLADRDAWARVDEGPGWIRAGGFFTDVAELPALVEFSSRGQARSTRSRTTLAVEDGVVLTRWIYAESHGDPYSAEDGAHALDALIELVVEALRHEVDRQLGPDVATTAAEEFLRGDVRGLAWEMLTVSRGAPGWERLESRAERWTELLRRHGLPAVEGGEPDGFWNLQMPVLLVWLRDGVAKALSTEERTIRPRDLPFFPSGEEWEAEATAVIERVWGGEDELYALVEPHLAAMAGFYGTDDAPRVRFESRVRLPGTLLHTDGTPDDGAVVWSFRQEDLTRGEVALRAESVEPAAEVLTVLGARREFDRASLLRLADILFSRDPDGRLASLLRDAAGEGRLDRLRGEDAAPPELQDLAVELADLLDPNVPLPEPL